MWRWCRSSVRNQSVASLIRNAIGISSVRAMPDPHQLVSNRNRSSSVSNFHDDSPFNARFSAIFFIYLARLIQINQSVKKLNGKFSRNNCARRIFVSITLYFDHKLKKKIKIYRYNLSSEIRIGSKFNFLLNDRIFISSSVLFSINSLFLPLEICSEILKHLWKIEYIIFRYKNLIFVISRSIYFFLHVFAKTKSSVSGNAIIAFDCKPVSSKK